MRLRPEQMAAFNRYALGRLEDGAVEHVARVFPERYRELRAEGVRELVKKGMEKARGWRVTQERDVMLFVDLMVALGPDFDEKTPWIREILEFQELSGSQRISRIYRKLS